MGETNLTEETLRELARIDEMIDRLLPYEPAPETAAAAKKLKAAVAALPLRRPGPDPYFVTDSASTLVPPRAWKGDQSWNYEATYRVHGLPVRVRIHRDGYDPQSYARAHVFSPQTSQWNLLAERPIALCAVRRVSYSVRDEPAAEFREDEQALLVEAAALLGSLPAPPDARP